MPNLTADQANLLGIIMGILVCVVVLTDGALMIAWAVRQHALDEGRSTEPIFAPTWSLVDVWVSAHVILGLLLGLSFAALFVLAQMTGAAGPTGFMGVFNTSAGMAALSVLIIVQDALLTLVPLAYIRKKYRRKLGDIGLRWPTKQDLRYGIGLGVLMICISYALEQFAALVIRDVLPGAMSKSVQAWQKGLGNETVLSSFKSPMAFAGMFIGGAIGAPIGEEVFFRGMLFNSAKRRLGLNAGSIVSALVFAVAHAGPVSIFVIFPMGLLLAMAYQRTGSLVVPILMHMTNNSVGMIWMYVQNGASRG